MGRWYTHAVQRENISSEFLRRAVAEADRYGDDPWVLLRELGQNSRDAHASRIRVTSRIREDRAILIFDDDGRGMSLKHARSYLFRLYASSKGGDGTSAGKFGVGFWSVLRFGAQRIEIHSRCKDESWGVSLSGDLRSWNQVDCRRRERGTTVILERPVGDDPGGQNFLDQVEQGLKRYLAHLRTAGTKARPLPVYLDGQAIHRPFDLRSPGALRFKDGAVEGVVGFGPRPAYTLYARGLPVAQGAFLDELEGKPGRAGAETEREGVAPVYIINGNNLDLVLSRQTVVRNRALSELIKIARQRFDELVSQTIDGSVERSLGRRMSSALGRQWTKLMRGPVWLKASLLMVGLVLIGGLGGMLISAFWTPGPGGDEATRPDKIELVRAPLGDMKAQPNTPVAPIEPGPARSMAMRPEELRSARTGTVARAGGEQAWKLRYGTREPLLFRLGLLDRYDPASGWQASNADHEKRKRPMGRDDSGGLSIDFARPKGDGWFVLPIPSGYGVVAGSARLGTSSLPLEEDEQGLVFVRLEGREDMPLHYRVVPQKRITPSQTAAMKAAVPVELPSFLHSKLKRLPSMSPDELVRNVERLVLELLVYDRSAKTVAAYIKLEQSPDRDWLSRVLEIGAGDCDVINGVLVILLREVGVPARLAFGSVGREGVALPGMHAWVEFEKEGRLVTLDATISARRYGPGRAPSALANSGRTTLPGRRAPSGDGKRADLVFAFWVGLAVLAALLVLLVLLSKIGHSQGLRMSKDESRRRKLLAGIALDAIRRPQAWRHVPGIWNRPILPCLGNRSISLARLVRLCRSEKAFVGSRQGALVPVALASGALVLDAQDPDFGELYSRTTNLRDLDELAVFKPLSQVEPHLVALVGELDRVLSKGGAGVVCRWVDNPADERLFWDVDLTPIKPGRRSPWPQKFIALNPRHRFFRQLGCVLARNPDIGLALVVDRLAAESGLLGDQVEPVRRAAGARVFEVRP